MKLSYQNKHGILYQGHTLDILKKIKDNTINLIFADPPFNIGKSYQDRRRNYRQWCGEWIGECFRVLKNTGSFYHMTLARHLEWKLPLMADHGIFINLIIWRNVSAAHNKRCFWGEYQPIMLYGKSDNYIFNTYAETEESGMRRWGGYSTEYKGQLKDRWEDIPFVYAGSIQHKEAILEPGTNKKIHPCFIGNTWIYGLGDIKKIKDIKIGDLVFTHQGRFKKVKNISKRKKIQTLKITAIGLESIYCSENHPFLILRPNNKWDYNFSNEKVIWEKASNLKPRDYLMFPIIYENKIKENEINWEFWFHDKKRKETIKITKDLMKLIGYFLSEGWVTRWKEKNKQKKKEPQEVYFCFHKKEEKYIKDVCFLMEKIWKIKPDLIKKDNVVKIHYCNKKIATFFKLFGHGSYNKRMPFSIFSSSLEYITELLQTFWYGDGQTINKNRKFNGLRYDTASVQLAYQIHWLLSRLSIPNSIKLNKRKNDPRYWYTITIQGKYMEDINQIFNENIEHGSRSYMKKFSGYILHPIKSIRKDKISDVYNLEVEEDHSYIANGCCVSNCQMPLGLVERAIRFSTNEGDVILDPFMGSGTSAIGAENLNRKWIGIELEEKYCKLTVQRIKKSYNTLFGKPDENFKENKQLQLLFEGGDS